jgi:hypothetical protein
MQEFVLDEVRAGFLRQLLAVGLGEQERRGVCGRPPQRIDRHDLPQPRQDCGAQGARIQARPAGLDDGSGEIVERRTGEHGSPISCRRV